MSRQATIWRVTSFGNMVRHYHFPTKKAAEAFVREKRSQYGNDDEPFGIGNVEIDYFPVPLTAAGVAQALDDFISMTCFNEG